MEPDDRTTVNASRIEQPGDADLDEEEVELALAAHLPGSRRCAGHARRRLRRLPSPVPEREVRGVLGHETQRASAFVVLDVSTACDPGDGAVAVEDACVAAQRVVATYTVPASSAATTVRLTIFREVMPITMTATSDEDDADHRQAHLGAQRSDGHPAGEHGRGELRPPAAGRGKDREEAWRREDRQRAAEADVGAEGERTEPLLVGLVDERASRQLAVAVDGPLIPGPHFATSAGTELVLHERDRAVDRRHDQQEQEERAQPCRRAQDEVAEEEQRHPLDVLPGRLDAVDSVPPSGLATWARTIPHHARTNPRQRRQLHPVALDRQPGEPAAPRWRPAAGRASRCRNVAAVA